MKRTVLFIMAFAVILLMGCASQPRTTATPLSLPSTALSPKKETPEVLPSTILPSTALPQKKETPVVLPSVTLTENPSATYIRNQCLEIATKLPASALIRGGLVLNDRNLLENSLQEVGHRDAYILNLQTQEKIFLAKRNSPAVFFSVSPNRKLVAYLKTSESVLEIAMNDGKILKSLPWQKEWRILTDWLNDQSIVIELDEDQPASLLILNPFSGKSVVLLPDYPKIFKGDAHLDWDGWGETVYDSEMSKVIYVKGHSFVLWDIKSRQEIATVPTLADFNSLVKVPKWSPDGTRLVVAAPVNPDDELYRDELFSIAVDGTIQQLTRLTSLFKSVDITKWSWSPDGRYIAFMLYVSDQRIFTSSEGEQLALLDTTTDTVTFYCIPGLQVLDKTNFMFSKRYSMASSTIPSPIWSPDSDQLLVENRYIDDASRLILIDINKGFAVQIAENVEPVGWMVSGK